MTATTGARNKKPPRSKTPLYTRPKSSSDSFRAKATRLRAKRKATNRAKARRRQTRTDAIIANKPGVAEKLGYDTNPLDGIQRPKGRKAAPQPRSASRNTSQSASPVGGTSSSGPERVPTTTGTTRASSSPVVRPSGKNKNKGKKTTPKGGKSSTTTATSNVAATTPEDDFVTTMFNAARRSLDRQQQIADAQRLQKLQDQKTFDEWASRQRASTTETLKAEFARTAADAAAARQQSLDAISRYANNAALQAGGAADMLKAAGADANAQAFGFQQGAVAQDSAGGAFTQSALMQRDAAMAEADRARAANMLAAYNADYRKATEDVNAQRSRLSLEEIKARQESRDAERQFQLDQKAAEFLQGLQQGELAVKQFDAQTRRLKVKADVTAAQAALQFKQQGLTLEQAKLQWRKTMDQAGLSQKEKDRKTRILIAKWGKTGKPGTTADNQRQRQDASKFIVDWHETQNAGEPAPRGDAGIAYARSAVQALRGFNPRLRSEQALAILSGFLPGDVVRDGRIRTAIANAFR